MAHLRATKVCFRNDDVNLLTPELTNLTEIFMDRRIPLTQAIEPGNLSADTMNWLKYIKNQHRELIEIVQHGWNHTNYRRGEFDESRSYEQQFSDLKRGKEKLEDIFREDFFPMITIPFGVYNAHTIKAADSLGFKVFCGHYSYRLSRRLFYSLGHVLRRGQLFGRHISNHLNYYPGTHIFEIDTALSFIKKYYGHQTNNCEMFSAQEIIRAYWKFQVHIPVVVFLLHHRFHHKRHHIQLIEEVLDELQEIENIFFSTYSKLYEEYAFSPPF